jgi:tRNA threonylcarbamoyladenosine biosynthesis protein TsaB
MNVLAVDGALGGFSAAIARNGRIAASRYESGAVALERGLAMVETLLHEAQLPPTNVERLAVGVGPGSFTGLRIAVAYAKALASVWQRALVPFDSFDLLEHGSEFERVLSVVSGRPGVISARYRCGSTVRRASGRVGAALDEIFGASSAGELRGDAALAVLGAPKDVLDTLAERRIAVRILEPAVTPAAAAAASLAPSRTPPNSIHEVRADYGELPAAKPPRF